MQQNSANVIEIQELHEEKISENLNENEIQKQIPQENLKINTLKKNCFILTFSDPYKKIYLKRDLLPTPEQAVFDLNFGWCFINEEEAEKTSQKYQIEGVNGKIAFYSEAVDAYLNGSQIEKKAINLRTSFEIEKSKLLEKETKIKNECELQGLSFHLLLDEQPLKDLSENEKNIFNKFKKRHDSILEEKENLRKKEKEIEKREEIAQKSKKIREEKKVNFSINEETEYSTDQNEPLTKARASARRRALINQSTFEEIIKDIRKQYSAISLDQAERISLEALLWVEKYAVSCEVMVNGIPKKITDMKSLDERFAQLEVPGQPCVTIHRSDAQPISLTDFNKRLSGEVIVVGVDQKGQPKYLPASTYWIGNTNKRIYRNITFTNKPVDENTYNLYTGLGLQPKEGDCSLILQHIYEVICAGNQENYDALIKLLAWQIQNIGKPSRVITIFKSLIQQIGKGTVLSDVMKPIYGNSGFMTSDIGQIITRFNDSLRGKVYIFLDEALFAGDRKSADAIKSISTTTRMGVETKGMPTIQLPIAVNFFLTTNHDDAAFIEEADARYWILEASPHRVKDHFYFSNLYEEIDNGGKEAFLHYLLNIDISNFIPARDVPLNNEAKANMIRNSINPYDARKWLEECCRSQMILGSKPIDSSCKLPWEPWTKGWVYPNGVFSTAYTEWQKTVKSPVAPKPTSPNKFGELLNDLNFELSINSSVRYRELPDINECLRRVVDLMEKSSKK